jgi:hypothetical protein
MKNKKLVPAKKNFVDQDNLLCKKPFHKMTAIEKDLYFNKNPRCRMLSETDLKLFLNEEKIKKGELLKLIIVIRRSNNKIYYTASQGRRHCCLAIKASPADTIENLYKTKKDIEKFVYYQLEDFESKVIAQKMSEKLKNKMPDKFYKEDLLDAYEKVKDKGIYIKNK